MSVNKMIIVGRLGKDPEIRQAGASRVCNLSVATTETFTQNGQTKERTEWHDVTAWNTLADNCEKYLKKGSQVYVEGKMQTETYEKNGEKRYSKKCVASIVQFLDDLKKQDDEDGFNF
jgi:single-strand DNA-binding protein